MELPKQRHEEMPHGYYSKDVQNIEAVPELSLDETNLVQIELAERLGITLEDWVVGEYSTTFRVLINGHDGPYDVLKDTEDAQVLRKLFVTDRKMFIEEMLIRLDKRIVH